MRGKVAPHLKPFLSKVNEALSRSREEGIMPTPELARENMCELSGYVTLIPSIAYAEERIVYDDQTEIPVRVYSPAPEECLPVLVYMHGGGHMCGSTTLYDPMCRKLAIASRCVVVSVEYRLAPEFPYPAGINDCEAVVKKYHQALANVNYSNELYIAGDSAGGALCATLAQKKATDAELAFTKQILFYPILDYTMSHASIKENGEGYMLERTRLQWYFDNYFDEHQNRETCSPLFNEMNEDMPDTLVIVAGCDPLRDEGLKYAERLQEAGLKVVVREFESMIHGFMNVEDMATEECRELYTLAADFINERLDCTICPPS